MNHRSVFIAMAALLFSVSMVACSDEPLAQPPAVPLAPETGTDAQPPQDPPEPLEVSSPAPIQLSSATVTQFATLHLTRPTHTPRTTLFIPGGRHAAGPSPIQIDGRPTEWHRVASLTRGDVVELVTASATPLSGDLPVTIGAASPPVNAPSPYMPSPLTLTIKGAGLSDLTGGVRDIVFSIDPQQPDAVLQDGAALRRTRSWHFDSASGIGVMVFWTFQPYEDRALLSVALHASGARVYFEQILLEGDIWRSQNDDLATNGQFERLALPMAPGDLHTLPPASIRTWRLAVGPKAAEYASDGWGSVREFWNASWGYLVQDMPVANFDHVSNLATRLQQTLDDNRTALALGTVDDPGYSVNPPDVISTGLWHPRGGRWKGLTGGLDRDKEEGALAASSGDYAAYETLQIEEQFEFSRQPGFRLDTATGLSLKSADLAAANGGRKPYEIFDNTVINKQPGDPLNWNEDLHGLSSYETALAAYMPHDGQHVDRAVNQSYALIWLANDPLSHWLAACQDEITIWALDEHQPKNGRPAQLSPFSGVLGTGTFYGRAYGMLGTALAMRYAVEPEARLVATATMLKDHLAAAQLPHGLLSAKTSGKVVTGAPFGHKLSEPCHRSPAIHTVVPGDDTQVGDWVVGRGPENIELISGLKGIHGVFGFADVPQVVAEATLGLQDYTWRRLPSIAPSANGTLAAGVTDKYPVAPIEAPTLVYLSRDDLENRHPEAFTYWDDPDGLPNGDGHRTGHALAAGILSGAAPLRALLGYGGGATTILGVVPWLEAQQLKNPENQSGILGILQYIGL